MGSWATGPTAKKNGEIVFDRVDQQSTLQKLEFEDTYAMFYFELMTAENFTNIETILDVYDDLFSSDMTEKNDLLDRFITASQNMMRFTKRTGVSNCILLRLSAAKIKLDGIEHKNT